MVEIHGRCFEGCWGGIESLVELFGVRLSYKEQPRQLFPREETR
jgi:hypothetical protein